MVDASIVTDLMTKQFADEDEYVMVSEYYRKLKSTGLPSAEDPKDRVYIMTTHHIYTFKDGKRARLYKIKDVSAILLSSQNAQDFMLFFERSDDLHMSVQKRQNSIDLLKLRFNCLNRNITLRCFSVTNQQIATFMKTNTTQSKKAGIFDLPED